MGKRETVGYLTDHLLERVLAVFDKAVLRIPPDHLDFRATPVTMRVRELAHHVYEVVYLLTRAVETGVFDVVTQPPLVLDLEAVQYPGEIVAYGQGVKDYVRGAVAGFDEAVLDRTVEGGPRETGFDYMMLAYEEALHHRGQLIVHLRLMGAEPPFLYDYS